MVDFSCFINVQNLCNTAGTIQDGLHAVSCACTSLSFNGTWDFDKPSLSASPPNADTCFEATCDGVLYAQSLVCYETPTTLVTYESTLTFLLMDATCANVSIDIISGHVYSSEPLSPMALSFLQTNYNLVGGNVYAVVENDLGVVVGQIHGAMIQISVQDLDSSSGSFDLQVSPCLLVDPTVGEVNQSQYDVYDVGILSPDYGIIHPLGKNVNRTYSIFQNQMICFDFLTISNASTSIILIQRVSDYENFHASTNGERDIVWNSGVLFCFGGIFLTVCHCFYSRNVPILIIGLESIFLLLFRGIYFFLLASGDITVGGLLDFALIEIPTFIYIGIFLQIIIPSYRFFFARNHSINISNRLLGSMIAGSLLVNWLIFTGIMIALSYSSHTIVETRSCDCQISDPVHQSKVAQIIRLVYKSFVLVIAIWVVIIIYVFRMEVLKAGGIQELYYQIAFLALGLFFDCGAFVIYYAVNSPTAYFLIILWFTELIPICSMNVVVTWVTKTIRIKLF
jgi:hypothetical protein